MIDKNDEKFLKQNIKGMMMTLIARWNAQMDEARAQTEFAAVRPGDIRLFAQLRGRTVKLSDIHREMGFSRQAAQQAINRLVDHDMICVEPDPDSQRDKRVKITEKGHQWRRLAAEQIRLIEEEVSEIIGENAKESLRDSLAQLVRTE